MADAMTLEPTAKEAAELQAEISHYLAEMHQLNELMAQGQKRIDALKVETREIVGETRLLLRVGRQLPAGKPDEQKEA